MLFCILYQSGALHTSFYFYFNRGSDGGEDCMVVVFLYSWTDGVCGFTYFIETAAVDRSTEYM